MIAISAEFELNDIKENSRKTADKTAKQSRLSSIAKELTCYPQYPKRIFTLLRKIGT